MDEKKRKLIVIEKTQETVEQADSVEVKPKFEHPNQTNPIYKNLAKFNNAKVGDKLSVKDLLR